MSLLTKRLIQAANSGGVLSGWASWDGTVDGAPVSFETGNGEIVASVAVGLGSNNILVAWGLIGGSGRAAIGTVLGDTISFGIFEEFTINMTTNDGPRLAAIDGNTVVITYNTNPTSTIIRARVLTVSGTTITSGPEHSIPGSISTPVTKIVRLDSTRVVGVFTNDAGGLAGTAVVLEISGTTITIGTPTVFRGSQTNYYFGLTTLDSNRVLVTSTTSFAAPAVTQVLTIIGLAISVGASVNLNSDPTQYISSTLIGPDKVLVAYIGYSVITNNFLQLAVVSVSGTSVVVGSSVEVFSSGVTLPEVSTITPDQGIVAFNDIVGLEGVAIVVDVVGVTVSGNLPVTLNAFDSSASIKTPIVLNNNRIAITTYRGAINDIGETKVLVRA